MKLATRLNLSTGILALLLILTTVVAIVFLERLSVDVSTITNDAIPLTEEALRLRVNSSELGALMLNYLRSGDPQIRGELEEKQQTLARLSERMSPELTREDDLSAILEGYIRGVDSLAGFGDEYFRIARELDASQEDAREMVADEIAQSPVGSERGIVLRRLDSILSELESEIGFQTSQTDAVRVAEIGPMVRAARRLLDRVAISAPEDLAPLRESVATTLSLSNEMMALQAGAATTVREFRQSYSVLTRILDEETSRRAQTSLERAETAADETILHFRVFALISLLIAIIATLGAIRYLRRGVTAPLRRLTSVAEKVERGDLTVESGIRTHDEIGQLSRAFDSMRTTLYRERRFLEAVLDNIDAGIVACDEEGNLTIFNRATREFHGFDAEQLPSEEWADRYNLFLPDGVTPMPRDEIPLVRAFAGKRVQRSAMVIAPENGQQREILASGQRLENDSGELIGAVVAMHDVTDLRTAERELRRLADRTRVILDSLAEGVYGIDREGRITFVNMAATELTGYEPSESLRRVSHDLIHSIRPDGSPYPRSECPIYNVMKDGDPRVVRDEVFLRKDGTTIPIEYRARPTRDDRGMITGAVVSFRDIAVERRMAQQEQRLDFERVARNAAEAERARMSFLAEASSILVSTLDYEKALRELASTIVPNFADWCAIDLLRDGAVERLAFEARPDVDETTRQSMSTPPGTLADPIGPGAVIRTGSAEVHYEISPSEIEEYAVHAGHAKAMAKLGTRSLMILPLHAQGEVIGCVTLARVKGNEEEEAFQSVHYETALDLVRRASSAVERSLLYDEASESNRLKDEFLATLSHELRTPLTAILGWIRLLRSGQLDEKEVEEGLRTIESSAVAQSQLIEDVLDVSRIISGKISLSAESIAIDAVLESAVDTIRPAAAAKNIEVRTEIDDVPVLWADPDRLRQAFWNVLSNAVKFTPRGGWIKVSLEQTSSGIEARITDSGEGIDPEFLPHVFERFRQQDSSSRRVHSGLGLGLSIVKVVIEMHGGSVRVESPGPNQGSTFILSLPTSPVLPTDGESRPGPERRIAGEYPGAKTIDRSTLSGLDIVVVDDHFDARRIVSTILRHAGARVTAAASVDDALEKLRKSTPDMVIADIAMPLKDGLDLIAAIRERGFTGPAIALTAQGRQADEDTALEAGYDEYLRKPIDPQVLIESVARHAIDPAETED